MPPRKTKDVDVVDPKKNTDHELFLQAFEKPTQIYRYIKTRSTTTPVFLYRTLSYMKHRMTRTHSKRKSFKMDSLLDRAKSKYMNTAEKTNLTVSYIGFFDEKGHYSEEQIKVETLLLKIGYSKRKDVISPSLTENVGTSYIPINPKEDTSVPKILNTLNINTDKFNVTTNYNVKSYNLVMCMVSPESENHDGKIDSTSLAINNNTSQNRFKNYFGTSIVIIEKQKKVLTDGDYEMRLARHCSATNANPAHFTSNVSGASWETLESVDNIVTSGPEFQDFIAQPRLKVKLVWSSEPVKTTIHIKSGGAESRVDKLSNKENNRPRSSKNDSSGMASSRPNLELALIQNTSNNPGTLNRLVKKPVKVVYQFVYNNNSRQQTTACDDFMCPWCRLDCRLLYALLKHLRCCHPRFKFTYHPMLNGALIDVAINLSYDKSYVGDPHHAIDQPDFDDTTFSRRGHPRQRCTGSLILVSLPRRQRIQRRYSMTEFINELEDMEIDGQRPIISGHNRLYHHTITCLPVLPKEMDVDSDDEKDPKWLQTKTKMMIDEFTDVNEGEKELMKMWNLHVMKYGFVGDCQIPFACALFLEKKGPELLKRNLYRNFVLHLTNLFDFGLISGLTVYTTIHKLQNVIQEEGDLEYSSILKASCEAQRKYWITEGCKKVPKLLEIRPPLSSPTGDGVRRKPGNYSPAHSPNLLFNTPVTAATATDKTTKRKSSIEDNTKTNKNDTKLSDNNKSDTKSNDNNSNRSHEKIVKNKKSIDNNLRKRVASLDDNIKNDNIDRLKKRRISSPDLKLATNCRVVINNDTTTQLNKNNDKSFELIKHSRTRNSSNGNANNSSSLLRRKSIASTSNGGGITLENVKKSTLAAELRRKSDLIETLSTSSSSSSKSN